MSVHECMDTARKPVNVHGETSQVMLNVKRSECCCIKQLFLRHCQATSLWSMGPIFSDSDPVYFCTIKHLLCISRQSHLPVYNISMHINQCTSLHAYISMTHRTLPVDWQCESYWDGSLYVKKMQYSIWWWQWWQHHPNYRLLAQDCPRSEVHH